tara:strand:+ start:3570 stop:3674 length:105 start_codon:yes stop_codon:yes gene_type:complete
MYKAIAALIEEAPRTIRNKGIIKKKKKFDPPQFQ